jgi:outer membrane autotransporter protein
MAPASNDAKDMKDMKDMKQKLSYATPGTPDYFDIFVTGSGTYGDMGNNADPGHFYYDRAQGNLGLEYHFAQDWTVGTVFSYAHSDFSYGNLNASTTLDSYLPTLFLSYYHEGWFANLSSTGGYNTYTEQRGTSTGTAEGASDGFQYGGRTSGGYLFQSGNLSFGPFAGVHYVHIDASGFSEDGAGVSDLNFDRMNSQSLQSQLGGMVRYDIRSCGIEWEPYFSASWQREYDYRDQLVTGTTSAGARFSGSSVYLDRDAALLDLGVVAKVSSNVNLYLGYEGQVAGNYVMSTAEGGVSVSF